ncbi:MAG TPA: prenyltransferase [Anaerolineales bacterium]|nr:prenyltransferase [Anaerolineales bacterium]
MINFGMWKKALMVMPSVSKEEWRDLDIISRWLVATRSAVLFMTFISAALAGIFAAGEGKFDLTKWLLLTIGLVLSHATNNLLNDYTDFTRGVDKENYYRTLYGPQPLAAGLMSVKGLLSYAAITGGLALACGIALLWLSGWDSNLWWLLGAGVFFVLFYTWPLKYYGLGEIAVILVWGPLMIAGGYYVLAGSWDWALVWVSLPYSLGVTAVIFGKHIDKKEEDHKKGIHTLPVILGERVSRWLVLGMFAGSYLITIWLVINKTFTPAMLVVLLALPTSWKMAPVYFAPRPTEKPEGHPAWPLHFVAAAFVNNRRFGMLFLLGMLADMAIRLAYPAFWQ